MKKKHGKTLNKVLKQIKLGYIAYIHALRDTNKHQFDIIQGVNVAFLSLFIG